jgi:hypothetical protein
MARNGDALLLSTQSCFGVANAILRPTNLRAVAWSRVALGSFQAW